MILEDLKGLNNMNVLVTSVGRRVKIIEYFKAALRNQGKVIAADCDRNAPALYFADDFEIVPRVDDESYISTLLEICRKHQISGIVSLIDPELEILARQKDILEKEGLKLILSPLDIIEESFDKQKTYDLLSSLSIPCVPTYDSLEKFLSSLEQNLFTMPAIVKPKKGSASDGIQYVEDADNLADAFSVADDLIIQPYYKDKEFGVDVYVDMVSGELVDMFIKEKILMRSGETDKSISVQNQEIEHLVKDFISKTDFIGPLDIDCFEKNGKYYISEINPRFGGGYPHAYEMGCDFMEYIVNNLQGKENPSYKKFIYEQGYTMMKYDQVKVKKHLISKV